MTPHRSAHAVACRTTGFTAIELLVAMAIVGVLSSLAYPAYRDQVAKARRADAIVALATAQMAQERWRSNRPSYGGLGDIGVAPVSSAGHYTLRVTANSATAYEILATARGAQVRDAACRNLRLGVAGTDFVYASGPDDSVANAAALNRRCWSL